MKFTPTWYKNPNFTGIPYFQEMEDVTGTAYDDKGNYIGPKEKPKMQMVIDKRTKRQYWAPEEYDEDSVKYGAALLDREFNSKEWWGMVNDPHLTFGEKISVTYLETLKKAGKTVAKAPTEIVAGVAGATDAVGLDFGNLAESVFATLNPVVYFGSQVARKGIKATAQDYVDLLKGIKTKTPEGQMGESAALYRAQAQNWQATLDKYLPDVDDNIKANSTLVAIGSMTGQIGGSLLLAAATSSVGGLPAVAGVFGSQQFYNLREEYLAKGYSLQSANIWAGVGAVAEGGLEALGFSKWLKYATLKSSLRNHLIAGLMESSQEMAQTTAEAVLTNFSGVREETLVEVLAQIAIAGVAGFIPGAGISLVSGGIGIRTEKAQYELDRAIEQTPKPVQPTTKEGQYIKGPNAKQELELAKANKGSNPVYEFVRNLAVANGIKGEEQIDALFYFARNQQAQGIVGEELLQGLGKQMVAYNKQLALPDKTADKENKKAAEDITYHLSEESAKKFRENTKSAAEKSGLSREEAERVADSETKIYTHLSQEFGEDVMNIKQVDYVVPSREEGNAPTVDEALAEAQAIDGQIAELKKIEGTQNQIAQLEQEKGKILSRGYIDMSGTINKIVLGNFSDVTTIKHELMHHWQYIIKTLAAKGNKKAQALQKQIDKIIAENKDYVKQDANKEAEVLTEAYELWLHTGVVADSEQQGLFEALKRFFQSVYSSAKDITGIRMNGEIDYLFRQMTGLAPIDMRGEEKASDVMFQKGLDMSLQREGGPKPSNKQDIITPVVVENGVPKFEHTSDVREYILNNLDVLGDVVVKQTGNTIRFNNKNVRRGLKNARNPKNNQFFADSKNAVANSLYARFEEADEEHGDVAGQDVYYAAIQIGKGNNAKVYAIQIKADVSLNQKDNVYLYAGHGVRVLEQKNGSRDLGQVPSAATNYSIAEFDEIFKPQNTLFQTGIEQRDLFATHNMNLAGAKQAVKMGGLAMPSMAIRKIDFERLNDFGEVSFVGNEKMVTPRRGLDVYDRDAWTPSIYASLRYRLSKSAKQKIEDILKKTGEEKRWSMYVYNIEEYLSDATRNEMALDLFLKEKGLPEEERQKKWNSPEYISWYNETFFDDATPYLFTENDDNTDMVERKFTLNNVMKVLRKQEKEAGGYIGDHLFSVRELIKFFPQKFRNLKELRAKKQNLQTTEQIFEKIEELDKDFDSLIAELRTSGEEKEYGADRHAVGIAIANTGDLETQKHWLHNAGLPSDNETISKINKFAERIKNEIPVSYFEAKPRRVVDFWQFSGVIMPNTKDYDGLANDLETKYNLPVFIIEKGNTEEYKAALAEIQKQVPTTLFQTIKAQQTGAKAADEKPSKEQIAKDLDIIKRNGVEKYEKKNGFWSQIGEIAQGLIVSVRQRAGAIDPKLKAFFDKLDYFQLALEKKFADQTKGWFKKYHDLSEEDKNEFDYYVYNQLHEELDAFLKEKNMTKEYQDVRNLLNFIYSISNQAGIDMGFISEYFPTSMIDHEGFLSHMKGTEKWTYIEKSLKEADPQGLWDSKQRAEAVNKLLRGYKLTDPVSKPKNAKERTILYKSPELMKFYEHSDKALMKYLQGMSRAIAINKAYGKGAGFDTDATIGAIVLDLIEGGQITRAEEDEVRHLLKSRLSYSATPQIIGLVKNVGYLGMMNNITSAVTQLGDLYAPFYKYSFPTAIQAVFGKKELDRSDFGLDNVWEEFSDKSKSAIWVDGLFKAIGLDKMDQFGKAVAIQASIINMRKQAEAGDIELLNRLAYTFGKDANRVLADIKSGKVTEEVKILAFCDLADTQPVGKSGVPTGYLNHPNMRLFYQLKTFMANQMSLFYADSLVNIQKGLKHGNKKQFIKGVQNGFKLVLLLTAGNASADVLKNLIMGREIDLEDTVVSNLLWNIGVSKYTFYKGKRDGYARALLSSYVLPPQVSAFDDVWIDTRKMVKGKREAKDSILWTYLPFGRSYYWWFGGGRTRIKEQAEKERKKKRSNRRNRRDSKNN